MDLQKRHCAIKNMSDNLTITNLVNNDDPDQK